MENEIMFTGEDVRRILNKVETRCKHNSDDRIAPNRLRIKCRYNSDDLATFETTEDGKMLITAKERGYVAKLKVKKKKMTNFLPKLKYIFENAESMRLSEREIKLSTRTGEVIEFSLNSNQSGQLELTDNETSNTIILHKEDFEQIIEFFEKFTFKRGAVKMNTIIEKNCIEEETDTVKIIDCDGKNIIIETDNDGELSVIYLNNEDAIKIAKAILAQCGGSNE